MENLEHSIKKAIKNSTKKMPITYRILIALLFVSITSKAQNYKDYLIDLNLHKTTDSIALNFCHNMWGDTIDDDCFTTFHIVYLTCGPILNFIYLKDEMIDTSNFTKQYFCSGDFLTDYINKDSEKCVSCKYYFMESRPFLYDRYKDKCYEFKLNEWIKKSDSDTSIHLTNYIIESGKFENFMGKLIGDKTLDCIFAYPTYITNSDGYQSPPVISTQLGIFFGIKDCSFYVLYENWTVENQGNNPQLYTIEEFIDCCWEQISNVKLK